MGKLQVIEIHGIRVLTTPQLAEAFGTEVKVISYNFNYNKDRYEEGKHYIALEGDERREFLNRLEIQDSSKHAKKIYLWTDKGVFLHAKSLNTDQAWDAYTNLVDDYFKKVEQLKEALPDLSSLSPTLQVLISLEQRQNAFEEKQRELEEENTQLRQSMNHLSLVVDNEVWITEHQKAEIKEAVKNRIGRLKSKKVDAHFQGLYGDLNTYFGVSKYDKIKRSDFDDAMEYVKSWYPKKKESASSQ